MAQTVPVYVSVNADNNTLNAQPTSTAADGLTEMWIRPNLLNYLLQNWQKYLVIDGIFKRTSDNFADLSVDHLLHENEIVNKNILAANETIAADKTALDKADQDNSKKIADTDGKVTLHDEAILELSDMLLSPSTPTSTSSTTTTGGES